MVGYFYPAERLNIHCWQFPGAETEQPNSGDTKLQLSKSTFS